jgi:hypothetical protein
LDVRHTSDRKVEIYSDLPQWICHRSACLRISCRRSWKGPVGFWNKPTAWNHSSFRNFRHPNKSHMIRSIGEVLDIRMVTCEEIEKEWRIRFEEMPCPSRCMTFSKPC